MAGRVRRFERNESVRHQELGMTRDSLGVSPSREPRESHTAPSGLPATRSGDAYSTLGRVEFGELQRKWEINKLSEYSLRKEFIEEEQKRAVDEKGRAGYKFKLSMLFPTIKESGLSSTNWNRRFFQLPMWTAITARLENTRGLIPGPLAPVDEFIEQTRVAMLAYQMLTKENSAAMEFRNKGEKRWVKENRKDFEEQIGSFAMFGRRSFYLEVRAMEHQSGEFENPVRAPPDRQILIRVELKQFLSFINMGINFQFQITNFKFQNSKVVYL